MSSKKIISFILRASLAITFIYAAIAAFLHPSDWVIFFPNILRNNIKDTILIDWWALFQITLSVWLLYGKRIFLPSLVSGLTVTAIILVNISTPDVVFQDIPALAAALSLSIIHFPNRRVLNSINQ